MLQAKLSEISANKNLTNKGKCMNSMMSLQQSPTNHSEVKKMLQKLLTEMNTDLLCSHKMSSEKL